jgi:hypothetical protein
MRVKSALWVAAYVRRCHREGAFAVVVRRGAEEAGAITVTVDRLDGTSDLYLPAPQSFFDAAQPEDRLFLRVLERAGGDDISARLASERKFDPDIWIVTVEDRDGRSFLELAPG